MDNKILKLKVYVDGGINDTPFPNADNPIEIGAFRYDAKRMGGAPTITASVNYPSCLDHEWTDMVYAKFKGEKYFLKQTPTSSKTNDDSRYRHEVVLVAERVILDNAYFYDAVVGIPLENDVPITNSTKFQFYGHIEKFVERMNASLQYTGIQKVDEDGKISGYHVVLDDDVITRDQKQVSFDSAVFSQALQEAYNTFGIPFYFDGQTIHVGFSNNIIEDVLEYGVDGALLSATKTNANFKVVNRATGNGSSDNIPYFYPNYSPKGEIEFSTPTTNKGVTSEDILIADKEQMTLGGLHPETEYVYKGDGVVDYNVKAEAPTDGISSTFNNGEASIVNVKTSIDDPSLISIEYTFDFNGDGEADVNLDWSLDIPVYQLYSTNESSNYYSRTHLELQVNGISLSSSMGETKPIEVEVKKEKIRYLKYCTVNPNYAETTTEGFKERATGIAFKVPNSLGKITVTIYARLLTIGVFWQSLTPAIKEPKCSINFTTSVFPHITGGWKANGEGESINMSTHGLRFSKNPVYGDSFSYSIAKYIKTSTNLQPSIYRATDGKERFYNAKNYPFEASEGYELQYGEYIVDGLVHNDVYKKDNGTYYEFTNEYKEGRPREHVFTVDDIKPTIKEMTNSISWVEQDENGEDKTVFQRIDMFSEFAYNIGDNDETYTDPNGDTSFKHPYFFGKLRKLDFNLFEHASELGEMTFSMTSGNCGACNFKLGVDEDEQFNPVQVYEEDTLVDGVLHKAGSLKYDENGYVLCGLEDFQGEVQPQDRQQDTVNYEVWIALKKEDDTYGILMPKAPVDGSGGHRPVACSSENANDGDTFVILNIDLPEEYVYKAEKKLEKSIIKYIWENNVEKFNFSVNFSRIFLEENPSVLNALNENARLTRVKYNGDEYALYVSSYSYTMNEGDVLPEIRIELDDTLTIAQNALQNAVNEVKSDIASAINAIDVAAIGSRYFLRKDTYDVAEAPIVFRKGLAFGDNGMVEVSEDGMAKLTIDYLDVKRKATFTSLEIQEQSHVGGQILVTPSAMVCNGVVELNDVYRCYFEVYGEGGEEIFNQFAEGDQAISQTFNEWSGHYYWRLVTGVGENYIDLSKSDCAEGSDVPKAGDKIIQLGNRDNKARQNAIVIDSYGEDAPSIIQYKGINTFELSDDKVVTKLSSTENVFTGKVHMEMGSSLSDDILGNLEFGKYNLLRNSAFTGDFVTESLGGDTALDESYELFSNPLRHWDATNVVVQDSEEGQSGKEIAITNGSLSQELHDKMMAGENYVLSFKAKGTSLTYSVGGVNENILLESEWSKHIHKFVATSDESTFTIESSDASICDLQLERGTVQSAWGHSMWDNQSELAKYQSLQYLEAAIKSGSTDILGGLIMSNIMLLSDPNKEENTAGVSGIDDNNSDVAFWGGGSFAQAIATATKYEEDPSYKPSEEEVASMAKYVVTHGGRAILNEAIVRGTVYAQDGEFTGKINANEGNFGEGCTIGDTIRINKGEIELDSKDSNNTPFLDGKISLSEKNGFTSLNDKFYINIGGTSCGNVGATFGVTNSAFSCPREEIPLQVYGKIDSAAISCGAGTFDGLRTSTEYIKDIWYNGRYRLLPTYSNIIFPSSGTYDINLDDLYDSLNGRPQKGQEFWIETLGADITVTSSIKMWSHFDGIYRTTHTFTSRGVIRFKYYSKFESEEKGIWTYTWVESH